MSDQPQINSILATDCGSTTTKAILIEKRDGVYRLIVRGEAPTTVEAPVEDVTQGVLNAITEVEELSGRKFLEGEKILSPQDGNTGVDIYLSTSSAGGGLQMMVAGVVRKMTAESAERAALGAGAIVMDVLASNDKRLPHEQIERIRHLRPDMILLSGGTDGGTLDKPAKLAELVSGANPRPRLGIGYNLPIIYAGNTDARGAVEEALGDKSALYMVENLRPTLETENLSPARDQIHELFMEHVMAQAPGYDKLMSWVHRDIMPTPGAVGKMIQTIAELNKIQVLGVDIGGATTDVFSVFEETFNRTVSANLGMSYSISNVLAEAGIDHIMRWVPFGLEERDVRNRIRNKMIRPTTIPQMLEELVLEQAVAREALRLAHVQHCQFATQLKGVQKQRTISDAFAQSEGGDTIVDMMGLDLLVGSGGVLSHAPRRSQSAMMLLDAFEPEGVTMLAVDSIFMMPQLGVLSSVHGEAAMQVFEKDCLIKLGSSVAPAGRGKPGVVALKYEGKTSTGQTLSGELAFGDLELLPLGIDETAELELTPGKGFDIGAGPGKPRKVTVEGGVVGLILDGRGRPIEVPTEVDARVEALNRWFKGMDLYPGKELAELVKQHGK